ncbi:MAG: alpha/beta fold hydrolase [Isosphaeraceae bacterium]
MNNATWRRRAVEQLAAGSRVAVTARGPVEYAEIGQGPVVLALHGRPGGYDQGLLMARSLGEDLARWIAVSRPGYLRTPLETGPTPAEQADAYAALLDTIGVGQAVALGLSGGGPSALQFALRHSDRCRGLVLVSAVTRRKLPSERTRAQKFYDSVIGPSDRLAWFLYRLFGLFVGAAGRQLLATALVLPETLRGAGRRNDMAQIEVLPLEPPAGIRVPTLIVHATDDRIVPVSHAEAAERAIPGARLVRIARGGHSILFARAGEIRPAFVEFLETAPTRV